MGMAAKKNEKNKFGWEDKLVFQKASAGMDVQSQFLFPFLSLVLQLQWNPWSFCHMDSAHDYFFELMHSFSMWDRLSVMDIWEEKKEELSVLAIA